MKSVFRQARPEEIEEIFSLYKKRIRWMDENGVRQWNATDYLAIYPAEYYRGRQAQGNLYALEEDGAIAAAAVLLESDARWPDREDSAAYYVHNLVTDSAVRGAGRRMLAETEALAARQGKRFVRLDCAVSNAFLNEYYGSMDYELAGRCREGGYEGNRREKKL